MDETLTFITSDGRFQFTIKKTFIAKYGNDIIKEHVYTLMTKYDMTNYLHNLIGPAINNLETGILEYFINGKCLDPISFEKIKHSNEFNKKLDKLLE